MKLPGILGALVGGAIGAVIWAAIAYFANMEHGLVAWGIGGLVGFASAAMGGQSVPNGVLCAVVALASILVGKGLAVHFTVSNALEEAAAGVFSQYVQSSEALAGVNTDAEIASFLVDDGWTEAESADEVTEDEVSGFKEQWIPFLDEVRSGVVTVDNWRDSGVGKEWQESVDAEISISQMVQDSLGPIDFLFAFLGIATAFKLGSAGNEESLA